MEFIFRFNLQNFGLLFELIYYYYRQNFKYLAYIENIYLKIKNC